MATLWLDRLQVCKRLGNGSQLVTKADYPPTTAKHRTTVYPVYIIDQWRICQTGRLLRAFSLAGKNKWCVLVQAKGKVAGRDQRDPGCGVQMMASATQTYRYG
jgi:hypothetical protein